MCQLGEDYSAIVGDTDPPLRDYAASALHPVSYITEAFAIILVGKETGLDY